MRRKGVSYDVGCVAGMSWRPLPDPDITQETYSDFAVPFNGQSRG